MTENGTGLCAENSQNARAAGRQHNLRQDGVDEPAQKLERVAACVRSEAWRGGITGIEGEEAGVAATGVGCCWFSANALRRLERGQGRSATIRKKIRPEKGYVLTP